MLAYTYIKQGKFELIEKPKPELRDSRDAIVRVTLGSICTSDLHIKHGGVPRAVPGITVGHEMVGIVEQTGRDVKLVKPGDRVTVNVETFCGECFFCRHRYVNNCADPNGYISVFCLTKRFVLQKVFFRTKKGTSEKILQSAFALCDVSYSQIIKLSSPFFQKAKICAAKP